MNWEGLLQAETILMILTPDTCHLSRDGKRGTEKGESPEVVVSWCSSKHYSGACTRSCCPEMLSLSAKNWEFLLWTAFLSTCYVPGCVLETGDNSLEQTAPEL